MLNFFIINILGHQKLIQSGLWYDFTLKLQLKNYSYIKFNNILFYSNDNKKIQIGKPILNNTYILGKILQIIKGKKLKIGKFRAKKQVTKITGYRSKYLRIYF